MNKTASAQHRSPAAVTVTTRSEETVVAVTGELDMSNAEPMRRRLTEELDLRPRGIAVPGEFLLGPTRAGAAGGHRPSACRGRSVLDRGRSASGAAPDRGVGVGPGRAEFSVGNSNRSHACPAA